MLTFTKRVLRKIKRLPLEIYRGILWQATIWHLRGKDGIEFGGPTELFYHPMHRMMLYPYIRSLDGCNLFEDNFFQKNLDKTFTYYKDRCGERFNVDTANPESLKTIPKTYDFILASHHIEHIANPIRALRAWKSILKKNGLVLAIMPHKDDTFDRKRPLTPLAHMIEDYEKNMSEADTTHIEEQLRLHDWSMGGMPDFERLSAQNDRTRVVHHHCFDTRLVQDLFEFSGYTTLQCYYIGNGNIVYLGKK